MTAGHDQTKAVRAETIRLAKYGVVGIATNLTVYLVYLGFLFFGVSPQLAVALTYALGVMLSYGLNRGWTFQSQASHRQDMLKFAAAYGIGFVFTIGAITILTRWLSPELAQIPNILLTALVIYSALRILRFGR